MPFVESGHVPIISPKLLCTELLAPFPPTSWRVICLRARRNPIIWMTQSVPRSFTNTGPHSAHSLHKIPKGHSWARCDKERVKPTTYERQRSHSFMGLWSEVQYCQLLCCHSCRQLRWELNKIHERRVQIESFLWAREGERQQGPPLLSFCFVQAFQRTGRGFEAILAQTPAWPYGKI